MNREFRIKKIVKIPFYWSKYSRRDFTIQQYIMLIVLLQYFKRGVESALQIIEGMNKVRKGMKLRKLPYESTISREMKRIPERWILRVIRGTGFLSVLP